MTNALIADRETAFLLHGVHDAGALCSLPHFADHDAETFELFVEAARRVAREPALTAPEKPAPSSTSA